MQTEALFSILHAPCQDDHWEMQTLTLELRLSADSGFDESNGTRAKK